MILPKHNRQTNKLVNDITKHNKQAYKLVNDITKA